MRITMTYKGRYFSSTDVSYDNRLKEYEASFKYGLKIFFQIKKDKAIITGSIGNSSMSLEDMHLLLPKEDKRQLALF